MSRSLFGLALALVMVVSLVVTAPARLVVPLLPGDRIIMQGLNGTLWRGSASRALVQAGPGYLQLGSVEWMLSPLSLLTFRPRFDLRSQWGRQRLSGELVLRGGADISVHDLSANLPAELIKHYLPVALDGDLSLQFAILHLREGLPYHTEGRLVWQRATWLSPAGSRPLGSYAVQLYAYDLDPLLLRDPAEQRGATGKSTAPGAVADRRTGWRKVPRQPARTVVAPGSLSATSR